MTDIFSTASPTVPLNSATGSSVQRAAIIRSTKETRAHDQEVAEKHYKTAMQDIQHENGIAQLKQFNREKSIRAAESKGKNAWSACKGAAEIQAMQEAVHFDFRAAMTSGNEVLVTAGAGYGGLGAVSCFAMLPFSLRRGERVFCSGPSGCGKNHDAEDYQRPAFTAARGTSGAGRKVSIRILRSERRPAWTTAKR